LACLKALPSAAVSEGRTWKALTISMVTKSEMGIMYENSSQNEMLYTIQKTPPLR